jgi:glycosyltransferase involved in cell wall biosynthesis
LFELPSVVEPLPPQSSTIEPWIWIDVEDLFEYRRHASRPSGIQRVEYELCQALAHLPETRERVCFVRHTARHDSFYVISYQMLENLYSGMVTTGAAVGLRSVEVQAGAAGTSRRRGVRGFVKWAIAGLPPDLAAQFLLFVFHQRASLVAFSALVRATAARAGRFLSAMGRKDRVAGLSETAQGAKVPSDESATLLDFARDAGPNDLLVSLGSPWFRSEYADMVRAARQQHGLRFALLVCDIIPLRRPEWFEKHLTETFRDCLNSLLPLVDVLCTISHSSADDVVRYAAEAGIALRTAPVVVPMGTGFTEPSNDPVTTGMELEGRCSLPVPGSYALIVSTIEARKNHILLFRVWRRLLEELPPESVPTLVFAGRVGWLVADLMKQLENARYLGGKIVLISDASDSDLASLYRGCQFTLFPSLYEGWGLPVTESLAFGRPCIVSNTTSLPEAGGTLARYFDPANGTEAYAVIHDTITDPDGLRAWQQRVAREFKPVAWSESALAVGHALECVSSADVGVAKGCRNSPGRAFEGDC